MNVMSSIIPRCLRCGSTVFLVRIPYGSAHDGEYICARCLDSLLTEYSTCATAGGRKASPVEI